MVADIIATSLRPMKRIGTSILTDGAHLVDVIEAIGFGWGQVIQLTVCGMIGFVSGVEVTLVSSIPIHIGKSLGLDKNQRAYAPMSSFFGASLGNIVAGPFGDVEGRRLPVLLSFLGIAIFQCASAGASNLWQICSLMFLLGSFMGLGQPPSAVLSSEIVPAGRRIHASFVGNALFVLGEIYAGLLIWANDPSMTALAWRYLLIMGAIPAAILLPISYFALYESPFFLALRHDYDGARAVLNRLRNLNGNPDVPTQFNEPPKKLTSHKTRTLETNVKETSGSMAILVSPKMIFTTAVVCILEIVCNLSYYGGMYSFPQVLPKLETTVSPAVTLMEGALAELPGCFLGIIAGVYMSRKGAMILSLFVTAASMFLFAAAAMYLDGEKASGWWEILLQSSFLGFRAITSVTFMILPLYIVETFPTRARTIGLSVAMSFGRIGGITAPMVYELLSSALGSLSIFHIIAALNLASAVLVMFLPFETKDKGLSDDHHEEIEPLLDKSPS